MKSPPLEFQPGELARVKQYRLMSIWSGPPVRASNGAPTFDSYTLGEVCIFNFNFNTLVVVLEFVRDDHAETSSGVEVGVGGLNYAYVLVDGHLGWCWTSSLRRLDDEDENCGAPQLHVTGELLGRRR